MDRFLSHFTNRLDAKGRVSVPAPFRAVLARDGFDGLYLHPSLNAPALDCGGNALLSEIDALLETMPAYSEPRDMLAKALLGTSEMLRLDSEGRVILSEACRSFAHLADEAVFVGQGHKFQIWAPDGFRAHLEEAKARVRQLRAELGARPARFAPTEPGE